MFQMRNMPFVAGRLVNWYRDILPVATQEVKDYVTEYRNGTGTPYSTFNVQTPYRDLMRLVDFAPFLQGR